MISSITPNISSNQQGTGLGNLGTDLFLELLVAQLQNQNPMEPMDGSALLQQTSQLANVEALQELSDLQSHVVGIGQFGTAAAMIGQTVTATDPILGTVEGVVSGVTATPSGPMLRVNGIDISLDQIQSIAINVATEPDA